VLTIRPIQPQDLEQLVQLCAEHAKYERQTYNPNGKLVALEKTILGDAPKAFIWVVAEEQKLLGFASLTLDFSTWDAAEFAHLDCLYLQPETRGKGIGKALFQAVLEFSVNRNCLNLQWQTPDWNTSAIAFYEHLGASRKNKQRFTYLISA
jgi:GNAT superfamily N-acetyltransferase